MEIRAARCRFRDRFPFKRTRSTTRFAVTSGRKFRKLGARTSSRVLVRSFRDTAISTKCPIIFIGALKERRAGGSAAGFPESRSDARTFVVFETTRRSCPSARFRKLRITLSSPRLSKFIDSLVNACVTRSRALLRINETDKWPKEERRRQGGRKSGRKRAARRRLVIILTRRLAHAFDTSTGTARSRSRSRSRTRASIDCRHAGGHVRVHVRQLIIC